nr:retrovirus-related Pol polyprotein from transposon TNT 1-94 [Tanacetum cinerariifolium]
MAVVEVPQTLEYKAGQRKPETQWTPKERKPANLDERLKRLIMFVLPDDQMNFVINCLTAKSTCDDLILYHEVPSDVKESKVMDMKLCYNTYKFKKDSQDSPDDEEDIRSSQEYMNDLEEEYQARALLAKSKRFFKKGTQRFSGAKVTDQTECHKCGKKDEKEVSSDDNEVPEVKALMALSDEERVSITGSNKSKLYEVEDLVFVKSSVFVKSFVDNSEVSITDSNKSKLSEAEDSTLSNHDTGKVSLNESQRNKTDHSVVVSDSLAIDYDSADESSVCSTPFLHWRS